MARPLPVNSRGVRRLRPRAPVLLLACPKLSPEWELGALQALMKPKPIHVFRHKAALQLWPDDGDRALGEVLGEVERRIGFRPELRMHAEGDYHFVGEVDREQFDEAKALAAVITSRMPDLWLVLGRLYARNGAFFRRKQGYKLRLVPAKDVHLRRDLRTRLRDLL